MVRLSATNASASGTQRQDEGQDRHGDDAEQQVAGWRS